MKIVTKNGIAFLETSMKVEDLSLVKKYDPSALVIKGGENNKEVLFIANVVNSGNGSVDSDCVEFVKALDGTATVTLDKIPAAAKVSSETMKEYLADLIGPVSAYITQLEASVPAAAETVRGTRKATMDAIEMA